MPPSIRQVVSYCEAHPLDQHPFLSWRSGAPEPLTKAFDILLNAYGLAANFPTWLAGVIAHLDDRRIQSLLARQLNGELGDGDPSRMHILLYQRAITLLAPFRPVLPPEEATAPAARLLHGAERYLCSHDPYEALGALVAGEVFGSQFFAWFGAELARQSHIEPSSLDWFGAHETVEVEHARDAALISQLVADLPERREAVWRGALGMDWVLTTFLSDLHQRYVVELP
ncbi:MAG TPA: iron-containing redox enzyme family protein [Polyangiaceae bacterium]|nr:iron-containing redox enzyme family protein [Polyangiaceae bacterium]